MVFLVQMFKFLINKAKIIIYSKHVGILQIFRCFKILTLLFLWSLRIAQDKVLLTCIITTLDSQYFLSQGGLYLRVNSDKVHLGMGC